MKFIDMQRYLRNIPNINRGGCGISALCLYDQALREGHSPEILYLYYSRHDSDIQTNQAFLEGKTEKPGAAGHIFVKIGKNLYDSDGKYDLTMTTLGYSTHTVTRNHLWLSIFGISEASSWCLAFDRSTYLPLIEQAVGYKLFDTFHLSSKSITFVLSHKNKHNGYRKKIGTPATNRHRPHGTSG